MLQVATAPRLPRAWKLLQPVLVAEVACAGAARARPVLGLAWLRINTQVPGQHGVGHGVANPAEAAL